METKLYIIRIFKKISGKLKYGFYSLVPNLEARLDANKDEVSPKAWRAMFILGHASLNWQF